VCARAGAAAPCDWWFRGALARPLFRGNRSNDQLASPVNREGPVCAGDRSGDERLDIGV
jgi:hypothetical protein